MKKTVLKIKLFCQGKRIVLSLLLIFTILISIIGIRAVSAYYHSKLSFSFLGTSIGNFDGGTSDIEIRIYKQDDNGKYNLIKNVPQIGYILNNSKTDCPKNYEITNNTITVSSNEKVTCRFYYDKSSENDVKLLVMLEDSEGDITYDGKNYKSTDKIPAYGYSYYSYSCSDRDVVTNVTYDTVTRVFKFNTTAKNNCYAYFKNVSVPDLQVDVYIQEEKNSNKYLKMDSIPGILTYKKSTTKTSNCLDKSGELSSTTIDYINGEVIINGQSPGYCTLYLDINS